jgi:hypothetical protein
MMHDLRPGDGTTAKSFTKVLRSDDGRDALTLTFKPPRGQEFVTLFLGVVQKGTADVDIDAMLERLGYVPKSKP